MYIITVQEQGSPNTNVPGQEEKGPETIYEQTVEHLDLKALIDVVNTPPKRKHRRTRMPKTESQP